MDLIDRQEAIDSMKETKIAYTGGWNKGLALAIDRLRSLPAAMQWIPCEDRLPDAPLRKTGDEDFEWFESEQVLICDMYGLIHVSNLVKDYIFNEIYWSATDDDELHGEEVTAWMPLPKPYGGDEE